MSDDDVTLSNFAAFFIGTTMHQPGSRASRALFATIVTLLFLPFWAIVLMVPVGLFGGSAVTLYCMMKRAL